MQNQNHAAASFTFCHSSAPVAVISRLYPAPLTQTAAAGGLKLTQIAAFQDTSCSQSAVSTGVFPAPLLYEAILPP